MAIVCSSSLFTVSNMTLRLSKPSRRARKLAARREKRQAVKRMKRSAPKPVTTYIYNSRLDPDDHIYRFKVLPWLAVRNVRVIFRGPRRRLGQW